MGVDNRRRRAAKAKARQHRDRTTSRHAREHTDGARSSSQWSPFSDAHDASGASGAGPRRRNAAEQVRAAAYDAVTRGEPAAERGIRHLLSEPPATVAPVIAELVRLEVPRLWDLGWQPADVARAVDRSAPSGAGRIVRHAIAADAASYAELGAQVAAAWMAQLERIGAAPGGTPLSQALLEARHPWPRTLRTAIGLARLLLSFPSLPRLVDPPSRWRAGAVADDGSLPPAVLDKVRGLLAKAESTTFDAEAEACTAKAQELMARHRIDRAVLHRTDGDGRHRERPTGRRIGVDDPYPEAKAALVAGIADANGCRAVWTKDLGFATVFGFPGELDATEELFTSLLVQATTALQREGSRYDRLGRSRTTRFRRSFLVAFANRITERLRTTVDDTVEAVAGETGTALVPLLKARDDEVRAATDEAYPELGGFRPTASDAEGWMAGTVFGDQADLGLGAGLDGGAP